MYAYIHTYIHTYIHCQLVTDRSFEGTWIQTLWNCECTPKLFWKVGTHLRTALCCFPRVSHKWPVAQELQNLWLQYERPRSFDSTRPCLIGGATNYGFKAKMPTHPVTWLPEPQKCLRGGMNCCFPTWQDLDWCMRRSGTQDGGWLFKWLNHTRTF